MTAIEQPDPRYITHADLEAFEGRIISRIRDLEGRMVTHRDLLVTGLAIIGVNLTVVGISAAALYFALSNLGQLVTALLPRTP